MFGLVKENLGLSYRHLPDDWKDGDNEYVECKKAPLKIISAEMGITTDAKTNEKTVFATKYLARKEFLVKESKICRQCRRQCFN